MAKIIIKGNKCYLEEETNIDMVRLLDDELSYKVPGAEFTKAFKGYFYRGNFIKWDGVERILSSDLSFPVGLLDRIINIYKDKGLDIEIDNSNKIISQSSSIDILTNLKKIGKYPRQYQFDILEAVNQNDIGIIRACTAAGKTLVSALMVALFGKKSIIYVISKDLLYQTHQFFSEVFDEKIGIIGDGLCDIQDINIVSVWTVGQVFGLTKGKVTVDGLSDNEKKTKQEKYQSIKDLLLDSKVHIFDECHLASCDTIRAISKNINPEHIYGMSASPYRDDGTEILIESMFGKEIINISASRLIREGFLTKPFIRFLDVPKKKNLPQTYQKIYQEYIVKNPERNDMIVKGAISLVDQGFKPLISYVRIEHGRDLYKQLSKKIPCAILSGKDSAKVRDKNKENLESGKIKCILASTIFDIGVDIPCLSGLILAGAGKSSVRALQRIGRVVRVGENKKIAAVIDFKDNAKYLRKHSLARRNIYSTEKGFNIQW